jgi:histidyl-tRNA synthetase
MAQKPSIPKGTRDFSPPEVARRNYIIETISKYFRIYGFLPIETPAMENMDTLMGKYGEEGDRLIFKILNSGDFISKVDDVTYSSKSSKTLTPKISEKALRYDLTVPFARYVVMHQNEIDFPFKRYQIQPVWRADRPQKGRFREFYQCDADVVGPKSMWQEVEFIQLYSAVFSELKLKDVRIKLNNRKVLSGIAEIIGARNHLVDFTVALDKLDKIGREAVIAEMQDKGIQAEAIEKARPLFSFSGSTKEKLDKLADFLSESETGTEGVEELRFIIESLDALGSRDTRIEIDVTLARGLNYYTGTIMEVAPPAGVAMGSIGGGGRYDDLTGIFGLKGVSGVGISFGLDRIYLVLEELGLFPEEIDQTLDVLCINFGQQEALQSLKLIQRFRNSGIKADLYPQSTKMQKQMKYANNRNVPYVVIIGEEELRQGVFVVKDMTKGSQKTYQLKDPDLFLSEM